ncbi:hypothetical protein B0O99DRAFT_604598 [Bisporella sp. PMI_857]|nr:hypothetical protein B0O99DRAFT_604598 [Bisporella sp. PMI_857]
MCNWTSATCSVWLMSLLRPGFSTCTVSKEDEQLRGHQTEITKPKPGQFLLPHRSHHCLRPRSWVIPANNR